METWRDGKEKSPEAICRKVAEAPPNGSIEIRGDGEQTRSFLYIEEGIEGMRRLVASTFPGAENIGSDEMTTINDMVNVVCYIANKKLTKLHVLGPLGVRGRNSDNTLIHQKLGWSPNCPLASGLEKTYRWKAEQVQSGSTADREAIA